MAFIFPGTFARYPTKCGLVLDIFLTGMLAALLASHLSAGEPRPDAQLKNRIFDGQVYLDDKVKADPALATDSLAEGRKWIG